MWATAELLEFASLDVVLPAVVPMQVALPVDASPAVATPVAALLAAASPAVASKVATNAGGDPDDEELC